MELILADKTLRDIRQIADADVDIDVGGDNDYEIKIPYEMWKDDLDFGNVIYIPGTEYGGIIGEVNTNTELNTVSMLGRTWRGSLDKKVIQPPSGQDYKKVSGELNTVLSGLIEEQFGNYFVVSTEDTGVNVNDYQFERYCTLLYGIEKMLKSVGHRIQIKYVQQERGQPGYVEVAAVPIVDYSGEIELSQDSEINFTFKNKRNGVNHLICLGKGELQERQVIHLYVQEDGTIGNTQYYKDIEEIAEAYENTSAETDELRENGVEKLRELMNSTDFQMDVASIGINVDIGDIIGGRDYITGLYAAKPITEKIYKITDGKESIEYSIEGDDEQGN